MRFSVFPTLRLLARARSAHLAAMLALVALGGTLPVAFTAATGRLVDEVARGGAAPSGPLVVVVALFAASQLTGPAQSALLHPLGFEAGGQIRRSAMQASLAPYDTAPSDAARDSVVMEVGSQPTRVVGIVEGFASMLDTRLQGIGAAALLFPLAWWAPFVLGGAWLLLPLATRIELREQAARPEADELERRSAYARDLLLEPSAAKEVRIFGLVEWLLERMRREWDAAQDTRRTTGGRYEVGAYAAIGAAYALVFWTILRNPPPAGALAVYLQAAFLVRRLGVAGWWISELRGALAISRALDLSRLPVPAPSGTGTAEARPSHGIRFEGVTFAYGDNTVLRSLDLEIPAGRSMAVVGRNGAGKSTLVRLLARLVEPTDGRVLVDGIDLRDLQVESWRSRLAVIFQDFVRYELTARENVAFGRLDERGLDRVAADAGLDVGALPDGWDTTLSAAYTGGVDLSGGQWQRVALARALAGVATGASVLVLDEPTASLDVRAEAALFDRFLELTAGLTTILVSHRFSTVRHADRICVLDDGGVVEIGTHETLARAGGLYARMFDAQARRFRDAAG